VAPPLSGCRPAGRQRCGRRAQRGEKEPGGALADGPHEGLSYQQGACGRVPLCDPRVWRTQSSGGGVPLSPLSTRKWQWSGVYVGAGASPHLLRIHRTRHAGREPSIRKTPGAAIIARHASSWRRPTERRRLRGHTPWMSSAMNALTGRLVGGVAAWWRRRSGPGPTEASPPALDHLHMPPLQFASRSALTRLPRDRSASARQGMQHARASHCPR
jgi:hypothetical protein